MLSESFSTKNCITDLQGEFLAANYPLLNFKKLTENLG